jgi:hypothetical protein
LFDRVIQTFGVPPSVITLWRDRFVGLQAGVTAGAILPWMRLLWIGDFV